MEGHVDKQNYTKLKTLSLRLLPNTTGRRNYAKSEIAQTV